MGFPNLPDNIGPTVDLNPEDAILLILVSIAFEELALAHVINAEAEKLQAALGTLVDTAGTTVFPGPLATDLEDLLDVNRSVERALRTVIKKEMLLQFKLEDAIDFFPVITTTTTTTSAPGLCDCSVDLIDFGPIAGIPTVITATPPIVVTPTSTLEIFADLCSDCDPAGNAFEYEFIRPAQGPGVPLVRQTFVAETFNITCDPTNTIMTVTGEGAASGQGPGHVSGPVNYMLVLEENTNTLTLTITRGSDIFVAVHNLTTVEDFTIEDCPPGT